MANQLTIAELRALPKNLKKAYKELYQGWNCGLDEIKFWMQDGQLFARAPERIEADNAFGSGPIIVHYQEGNAWLDSDDRWVF
jgi:hypothetical protein